MKPPFYLITAPKPFVIPIVLGPLEYDQLAELRNFAELHPISHDELWEISQKTAPGIHERPSYSRLINFGFMISLWIEPLLGLPDTLVRRMRIFQETPGYFPGLTACQLLMDGLGFTIQVTSDDCIFELDNGIVYFVEPIKKTKMNSYVKEVCRIGQGKKCCRYLTPSKKGLECAKMNVREKAVIDRNFAIHENIAQGDNCTGKEDLKTAQLESFEK